MANIWTSRTSLLQGQSWSEKKKSKEPLYFLSLQLWPCRRLVLLVQILAIKPALLNVRTQYQPCILNQFYVNTVIGLFRDVTLHFVGFCYKTNRIMADYRPTRESLEEFKSTYVKPRLRLGFINFRGCVNTRDIRRNYFVFTSIC